MPPEKANMILAIVNGEVDRLNVNAETILDHVNA